MYSNTLSVNIAVAFYLLLWYYTPCLSKVLRPAASDRPCQAYRLGKFSQNSVRSVSLNARKSLKPRFVTLMASARYKRLILQLPLTHALTNAWGVWATIGKNQKSSLAGALRSRGGVGLTTRGSGHRGAPWLRARRTSSAGVPRSAVHSWGRRPRFYPRAS